MEREHLKLISSEEKQKYLKVVEDYCKDIEKVKKRLIIKIIILSILVLTIALLHKYFPYIIYVIVIPTFIIGKNLGQNTFLFGYEEGVKRDVKHANISEVVTFVEGCYPDEGFAKSVPGHRKFLKINPRYYYLSRFGYRYHTHKKVDFEMYSGHALKVKIVFTTNTRLVLEITPVQLDKYDIRQNMPINVNGIIPVGETQDELKLNAVLNRQHYDVTSRYIKFPVNIVKHKSENYIYYVVDAYYKNIIHKRSERELNIIANKIKECIKECADKYDEILENLDDLLNKQIKINLNELIDEVEIAKINTTTVISKTNDLRKYIIL